MDNGASRVRAEYDMKPLFLIGFPRSGTTWLNKLCRENFSVGLVNEGQFIIPFAKKAKRYKFSDADSLHQFIRRLRRDHFFIFLEKSYGIYINWEAIKAASLNHDYACLVWLLLDQIRQKMGKAVVGSKWPGFGWQLELIVSLFPACNILHIIRDGRDCALSHFEMRWGQKNTYSAALQWRNYVDLVQSMAPSLGNRYLEIRYEDLLRHPNQNLEKIGTFLEARAKKNCDWFSKAEEDKNQSRHPVQKWKKSMTLKQRQIFESVASDKLKELGYEVEGHEYNISLVTKCLSSAHNRLARESWHIIRKVNKSIPEKKSKMSSIRAE